LVGLLTELRQLILEGAIDGAIDLIQQHFPALAGSADGKISQAAVMLRCQKFIELIRTHQVDQCLEYARNHLYSLIDVTPESEATIQVGTCSTQKCAVTTVAPMH
jgi:hypothetical protein